MNQSANQSTNQSPNQKFDAPLWHFLDSHQKIHLSLRIFAIFVAFLSALSIFSYIWIVNNYYADITIDVVMFHLRFPLVGVNSDFLISYATRALIPSVLVAILFAIRPNVALFLGLIFGAFLLKAQKIIKVSMIVAWQQHIPLYEMVLTFIKGGYFKSFWWNEPFGAWFAIKAILWIGAIAFVIFAIFWLFKKICAIMNLYAQITLFIAVIVLNAWILDSHFHLQKYFAPKDYSNFYEENYRIEMQDLPRSTQKRNLIVIFVESLESNFLIPNLRAFANQNVNFSTTQGFGGHNQVGATSWTIAGMIGYMCGIPLNSPSIIAKTFLPNAECVSDSLAKMGYNQVMIMGENDDFVAKGAFLATHKIQSKDVKHYKKIGALPNDYPHHWGFSDSKLFEFAKDELRKLTDSAKNQNTNSSIVSEKSGLRSHERGDRTDSSSTKRVASLPDLSPQDEFAPFALYLLTNNTHSPDFFIESTCGEMEENYQNAINCEDSLIGEFVAWIRTQDFYENTTILIVGDHLMNANIDLPRESRKIYNVFINPRFCDSHTKSANLSPKSRNLSHFDFAPLILDSLGICTKSFGLGRNPFLGQTLLESNGVDFASQISADSRLQESFWQRD
ncbi:sulfatase-like hydrolase/transferase [Helicobacter sp. 23-1045]